MWPQGIEKRGAGKEMRSKGKVGSQDIYDFLEHCEDALLLF